MAWSEHQDSAHRRVVLPEVAGAWAQLELFTDLYLPGDPADPTWILWTEAWARAPHNPEVCLFLDELMRPWYEDLAAIVRRGRSEGTFGPLPAPADFTTCFCAMLDGLGIVYLNQRPDLPRERLIELAMNTARTQLAPGETSPAGKQGLPASGTSPAPGSLALAKRTAGPGWRQAFTAALAGRPRRGIRRATAARAGLLPLTVQPAVGGIAAVS